MNEELTMKLGETKTMSHDEFASYLLHDFIDEAMAKKDRTVSIYMGENGVSISLFPLEDNEEE